MKQKVIICKGLPASGKSTWAKKMVESHQGHYKRISKDDLRAMLDNGKWTKSNEKNIIYVRDNLMNMLLVQGYSVIIDDTNLHPKHEQTIHGEVVELMGDLVKVEVKDFTNVSLEECIKRDQKRSNPVGEKVIRNMYKQFLKPPKKPVLSILNGKYAVICDLDGTLALFEGNPYNRDFSKDSPNFPVIHLINQYLKTNDRIIFVSGRDEIYREQTIKWLIEHLDFTKKSKEYGNDYIELYMRKHKDNRKDAIVKEEIFHEHIEGKYNIRFILDDRNQMVEMWRDLGLPCFQVNEGDF